MAKSRRIRNINGALPQQIREIDNTSVESARIISTVSASNKQTVQALSKITNLNLNNLISTLDRKNVKLVDLIVGRIASLIDEEFDNISLSDITLLKSEVLGKLNSINSVQMTKSDKADLTKAIIDYFDKKTNLKNLQQKLTDIGLVQNQIAEKINRISNNNTVSTAANGQMQIVSLNNILNRLQYSFTVMPQMMNNILKNQSIMINGLNQALAGINRNYMAIDNIDTMMWVDRLSPFVAPVIQNLFYKVKSFLGFGKDEQENPYTSMNTGLNSIHRHIDYAAKQILMLMPDVLAKGKFTPSDYIDYYDGYHYRAKNQIESLTDFVKPFLNGVLDFLGFDKNFFETTDQKIDKLRGEDNIKIDRDLTTKYLKRLGELNEGTNIDQQLRNTLAYQITSKDDDIITYDKINTQKPEKITDTLKETFKKSFSQFKNNLLLQTIIHNPLQDNSKLDKKSIDKKLTLYSINVNINNINTNIKDILKKQSEILKILTPKNDNNKNESKMTKDGQITAKTEYKERTWSDSFSNFFRGFGNLFDWLANSDEELKRNGRKTIWDHLGIGGFPDFFQKLNASLNTLTLEKLDLNKFLHDNGFEIINLLKDPISKKISDIDINKHIRLLLIKYPTEVSKLFSSTSTLMDSVSNFLKSDNIINITTKFFEKVFDLNAKATITDTNGQREVSIQQYFLQKTFDMFKEFVNDKNEESFLNKIKTSLSNKIIKFIDAFDINKIIFEDKSIEINGEKTTLFNFLILQSINKNKDINKSFSFIDIIKDIFSTDYLNKEISIDLLSDNLKESISNKKTKLTIQELIDTTILSFFIKMIQKINDKSFSFTDILIKIIKNIDIDFEKFLLNDADQKNNSLLSEFKNLSSVIIRKLKSDIENYSNQEFADKIIYAISFNIVDKIVSDEFSFKYNDNDTTLSQFIGDKITHMFSSNNEENLISTDILELLLNKSDDKKRSIISIINDKLEKLDFKEIIKEHWATFGKIAVNGQLAKILNSAAELKKASALETEALASLENAKKAASVVTEIKTTNVVLDDSQLKIFKDTFNTSIKEILEKTDINRNNILDSIKEKVNSILSTVKNIDKQTKPHDATTQAIVTVIPDHRSTPKIIDTQVC